MKIGILTFHRAINYGAFLQAFSLMSTLRRMGNDVDFVDYWPKAHADTYKLFRKSDYTKGLILAIKLTLYNLLQAPLFLYRKHKMGKIQQKHLHLTKTPQFIDSSLLNFSDYAALVFGSDQIWWKSHIDNYEGFDKIYWGALDSKVKKVAYAPSMGVIDLNYEDKKTISNYLLNFDSLSVRESGLKEALQPFTDKNIRIVLDPVFLTPANVWMKYLPNHKDLGEYVLLFNLMDSSEAVRVAERKAKELHCKVIEVTARVYPTRIRGNVYQTLNAFEFLYFIKNAKYVVTSSFHGTAFSIIFNKEFVSMGMKKNSGRVQSLLKLLEIQDRLINKIEDIPTSTINYEQVYQRLHNEIEKSKKYLFDSLS